MENKTALTILIEWMQEEENWPITATKVMHKAISIRDNEERTQIERFNHLVDSFDTTLNVLKTIMTAEGFNIGADKCKELIEEINKYKQP